MPNLHQEAKGGTVSVTFTRLTCTDMRKAFNTMLNTMLKALRMSAQVIPVSIMTGPVSAAIYTLSSSCCVARQE